MSRVGITEEMVGTRMKLWSHATIYECEWSEECVPRQICVALCSVILSDREKKSPMRYIYDLRFFADFSGVEKNEVNWEKSCSMMDRII